MAAHKEKTAAGLPKVTQQSLAWLACPACRSRLELSAAAEPTMAEPTIQCMSCRREFKIADGLPVLLP
jgi:uncharacterized protein YbaR (Trm112 family)